MAISPLTLAAGEVAGHTISSAANFISAERQMKFQREMAGSRHQRTVKDLKKAGLNPILSATQGPTPPMSGTSARATPPDLKQIDATSALTAKARKEIDLTDQSIDESIQREKNEFQKTRYNSALSTEKEATNQWLKIKAKGY